MAQLVPRCDAHLHVPDGAAHGRPCDRPGQSKPCTGNGGQCPARARPDGKFHESGGGLSDPLCRARLRLAGRPQLLRSEEHTSELQSLMRISYAVFCLKKNTNTKSKI